MTEVKAVVLKAGPTNDEQPVRFSIELAPSVYAQVVNLLSQSEQGHDVADLLTELESYLGVALFNALADMTGLLLTNTPFPQDVEVEMRVIQRSARLKVSVTQKKYGDEAPMNVNS